MASLYLDPTLPADVVAGSRVRLEGDEARHAITVARVRVGERIAIGDGAGRVVRGTVAATDGGAVELDVDDVSVTPRSTPEIWLAQALAKGDRDELAIQAATELGAAGVIPWAAERSVSRWVGPKAAKGRARWAAIVRQAAKQSLRPHVPDVAEPATTADLAALPGVVLVLDPEAAVPLTAAPLDDAERITLVVGPEGGIAPGELELLARAGALPVRLGAEVLRTSTAGPAAIAALHVRGGRW